MVLDPSQERPSGAVSPPSGYSGAERPEHSALQPGLQARSLLTMVGAVEVTVADALVHIAERAAATLPAADAACAAAEGAAGRRERAATAAVAADLLALQEDLGEGPSLEAAARRRPVVSSDLAADPSWPGLAAAVPAGAVRSVLVLPLLAPSGVIGTLTLCAFASSAFDDRSRQLGVRLASSAAQTLRHALVLDQARRLTAQRHLRGSSRKAVDRATAVLMEENGVGAEEAYGVLQLLGRTEQDDLVTVARAIVAAEDAQQPGPLGSDEAPPPVLPRG